MDDQTSHIAPLCDICRSLHLSEANNRKEGKYSLGSHKALKKKATEDRPCPFCALVYPFSEGQASIKWGPNGGFHQWDTREILAFLDDGTANSPYGCARAVTSQMDPLLISKWIKLCETHHEETCNPKRNIIRASEGDAGVKVLRVIDTENQCIVEAVPGIRYLTLSYVWGQVVPSIRLQKNNLAKLTSKGALHTLRERLPKTIRDAIDLVKLIGERYLWVDSLCLIQDDDDDMLDGISHMDLVYQCAMLTIVAMHGEDANAGLPGVHAGSRAVNQEIVAVLPGVKMTIVNQVYNIMLDTAHSQRGWTMQELVLSHRTLIFSKDRIYFLCRENWWSEDTIYDNFPSAINDFKSSQTISFLSDEEPEPLVAYNMKLYRYCQREFSKESDRIHGFTGILRALSIQMKSGFLEGLFVSCFDISIISWNNYPFSIKSTRKGGFPSWSWAGWGRIDGGYGFYCKVPDETNSWLRKMTYIVWYKRIPGTAKLEPVWDPSSTQGYGELEEHHIGYRPNSNDSYGRTSDESLENLKTKPDEEVDFWRTEIIHKEIVQRNYHFLHFFAHVVLVTGFMDLPSEEKHCVYTILGADRRSCGRIRFDDPQLVKEVQGPHELVLLSKMDQYDNFFYDDITFTRPFYWVMLIARQGEEKVVAERRGIGIFFEDCIKYTHLEGKEWKEIVLA